MQKEPTPHLLAAAPVLIGVKDQIVSQWLRYEELREVLKRYRIDIARFESDYAGYIFDYFMGVILGDKNIGECPVMVELLNYLKNHDVSADELFILCSNLRRAILEFSYDLGVNTKELFMESSYIFDQNFSALLRIYADRIHLKELELAKNVKLLNEYRKAIDESAIVSKTDTNGTIIYANDNFCGISGYDREELIGVAHNITRHPDMPAAFFKELWDTIKAKQVFKGTIKNRRKNGEYYYVDTTILPIIDPVKEVTEYMSIGYDVTKLVDATQQAIDAGEAKDYFLSNMSHEIRTPLNAILGFVTLLLEEENAPKHKKYLDIIHKSGQSLLSIINDILDFSKLRSGEFTVDPKVFDPHEEIPQALELFASDANEKAITLFSFMDPAIPHELIADPLRIKQIVSNFLSNAIKFTPYKGRIDVEAKYEEGSLRIKVTDSGIGISEEDQQKIFQAFSQAHNGVARVSGGTGLGLSICQQLAEHMDGTIELKSALGRGSSFELILPVKTAESGGMHLFDPTPFKELRLGLLQCCEHESQKLASLKRHWQAFDLEVVTVDRISDDAYDLLFFVDSEVDDEMRAKIIEQPLPSIAIMEYLDDRYDTVDNVVPLYFPIYCAKLYSTFSEALQMRPKTEKIDERQHRHRHFNAHVLVAEDNAANQELIKIILERYGIRHTVVPDGTEALSKFQSGSYDMILMDEQMPLMNGIEAMQKIVEFERFRGLEHTPIVALTANVIKGARERGLSAGYDAFLGKPVNIKEIERVFEQFLKEEDNAKMPLECKFVGDIMIRGIDVEKLKEDLMLEPDQIIMLLKVFLKKMDQLLPELEAAIETTDLEVIARLGHTIKGSSANFRMEAIQNLARRMEEAAAENDGTYDYGSLLEKLEEEIGKIGIEEPASA